METSWVNLGDHRAHGSPPVQDQREDRIKAYARQAILGLSETLISLYGYSVKPEFHFPERLLRMIGQFLFNPIAPLWSLRFQRDSI